MKTYSHKWLYAGFFLLVIAFASCSKNDASSNPPNINQNKLSIYLTDGPGYFDSVLVNIKSIAVKIDSTQKWWGHDGFHHNWWNNWGNQDQQDPGAFWDTLQINPGIYNLLKFANGADTVLSSTNIPKGRIVAFKITLSNTGNSLVKNGVSYPLNLVPGWSTVYIRVFGDNFQSVTSNHYKIWIDFDAGRSVIKVFDGQFYLRPFLRAYAVSNTGSVTGIVKPRDAMPVISVGNSTDTLYAMPGKEGMFMVRGLPEGTYSVFINASNGYQDTTINNVNIISGKSVNLGTIKLHK